MLLVVVVEKIESFRSLFFGPILPFLCLLYSLGFFFFVTHLPRSFCHPFFGTKTG